MKKYSLLIFIIIFLQFRLPNLLASKEIEITQKKDITNEIILDSVDDVSIVMKDDIVLLKRTGYWEHVIGEEVNIKLVKFNNSYLISSILDNKIKIRVFEKNGKLSIDKFLDENAVNFNYDCQYYGGYFYFVGSVNHYSSRKFTDSKQNKNLNSSDAYIIKTSVDFKEIKVKVFGGLLDEEFNRMVIKDDKINIVGRKSKTTGGDFGNGGKFDQNNIFIARLSLNLELENFNTFNTNNRIVSFSSVDNMYLIMTTDEVIMVDQSFNLVNSVKLIKNIYSFAANGLLLAFEQDFINLYDSLTLELLKSFNYDYTFKEDLIVLSANDTFYTYYMEEDNLIRESIDIYVINNNANLICLLDYCPLPSEVVGVETLFREATLKSYNSYPRYQRNIHGNYEFELIYQIRDEEEITVKSFLEVYLEVNISNNGIYPLGYRLNFTGYARLNGAEVFNNYPLNQEGIYELSLIDCNNIETRYTFTVSRSQFNYTEPVFKTWDLTTPKNGEFYIKVSLKLEEYKNLDEVNFKNIKYKRINYKEEEEKLYIYLNSPSEVGLHIYYLDSLKLDKREIALNHIYLVNVLKDAPSIEVDPPNYSVYNIYFNDLDNTLKFFEAKVIQDSKEQIFRYGLGNNNIVISNITKNKPASIELSFNYDLGDNITRTIKILDLEIIPKNDFLSLGHLEAIKQSSNIEQLKLELTQKTKSFSLITIRYNHEEIIFKVNNNKWIYISLGIFSVFSFSLAVFVKRRKKFL